MFDTLLRRCCSYQENRFRLVSRSFISVKGMRNFLTFLFLFFTFLGSATNYYVSNSGNDSSAGTTPETAWQTINKINRNKFAPGDQILFEKGGIWREQLIVPTSGTSGSPIVFGAYGNGNNPIIDGADIISTLTNYSTNIWQKAGITTAPYLMYLNGTVGIPKTSIVDCTSEGDWYWDSGTNVFSVYSKSNPSGKIELGQRKAIFNVDNRNYITISNLTLQYSNENCNPKNQDYGSGAVRVRDGSYLTVTGCTIQKNGYFGVRTFGQGSSNLIFDSNTFLRNGEGYKNGANIQVSSKTNLTFTNNQCNYSGQDGLRVSGCNNATIHGNHFNNNNATGVYLLVMDTAVVYNNFFDSIGDEIDDSEDYAIGIESSNNIDIYQNTITNQLFNDAIQISSDGDANGSSNNISIYRNIIDGVTKGDGIGLGAYGNKTSENLRIYYNVIKNVDHYGIYLHSFDNEPKSSVSIFNNTFYGNKNGGVILTKDFPAVLKNNIFVNNGEPDVNAYNTTGLTTSNNLYYRTSGYVLRNNSNLYTTSTIKSFEVSAQNTDPLFTDAVNGDFTLRTGSAAINNGVDVMLNTDILGNSIVGMPDIGAFESQQINDDDNIDDDNKINNTAGYTEVYNSIAQDPYLRAMPVTFNEAGEINSISIYHEGGTGDLILGVYSDQNSLPSSRLGLTASTVINSSAGWQTVSLTSPVSVNSGQTVWLSWVFENNPGIRFTSGTPGRAYSTNTWSAGMPDTFGSASILNTKYSIYCNYTPGGDTAIDTLGYPEVYSSIARDPYLRAMPVTFNEAGEINSISIYHEGGTGNLILGVYSDQYSSPSSRLGLTASTVINSSAGWQTVSLTSPVSVNSGQTVWLSWVFQNNPGIRYTSGTPGRAYSTNTWSEGMPDTFGSASFMNNKFSIYCNYTPGGGTTIEGYPEVYSSITQSPALRAMPVTFNEAGEIYSISIYHEGGTGNLILGVYSDQNSLPSSRLGLTASTVINSSAGWQTVSLTSPVSVNSGQTVWLSWVFQNNPGIRYTSGTPGRAYSTNTWSEGMPATFGSASIMNNKFSIYCNYTVSTMILKDAKITEIELSETSHSAKNINKTTIEISDENSVNPLKKHDFKLYPNPANSFVNLDYVVIPDIETRINIIDGSGRTILNRLVDSSSNRIDISQFSSGLYYVKSINQQWNTTKKLIIKK
jgi:parallel beta-helix repeat protein